MEHQTPQGAESDQGFSNSELPATSIHHRRGSKSPQSERGQTSARETDHHASFLALLCAYQIPRFSARGQHRFSSCGSGWWTRRWRQGGRTFGAEMRRQWPVGSCHTRFLVPGPMHTTQLSWIQSFPSSRLPKSYPSEKFPSTESSIPT